MREEGEGKGQMMSEQNLCCQLVSRRPAMNGTAHGVFGPGLGVKKKQSKANCAIMMGSRCRQPI